MTSKIATSFSIQTPLLAFEAVFRHTGTIRRTCMFHNQTDGLLQMRARYGFKEHSWIQLCVDDGNGHDADEPDRLVLKPGATAVHVLMNTDSSNFPYDRFRGRIYFEEPDDGKAPRWLEISFELIEELRDFEGYAAFDIGTSNSTAAVYHLQHDAVAGAPWNPTLDNREVEVPSAVFIHDLAQFRKLAPGSCAVGSTALEEYRRNPANDPRSLQVGVKRLVGADRVLAADARGAGGYLDPLHILYTLGRFVRERSQSHEAIRARLRRLMVTFPPTWDHRQINRWKRVFMRLGFLADELDLSLDEASAAGLFYLYRWTKDLDSRNRLFQDLLHSVKEVKEGNSRTGEQYPLNLLCFDFGGGTIDLALIHVDFTVLDDVMRMRITLKGSDSLSYGGDQVTLAAFRILKRRLAMALSDPRRLAGENGGEPDMAAAAVDEAGVEVGRFLLPSRAPLRRAHAGSSREHGTEVILERWEELERHITDERLSVELEDAVDAVFPTHFWRSAEEPISPNAKQNFGWLWEQAERLKKTMFREASRRVTGLALKEGVEHDIRGGIPLRDLPEDIVGRRRLRGSEYTRATAWVTVGEIYRCIQEPLGNAVALARRLAADEKVDRIVLAGQSSWIPLVRRLLMRPPSEGGFGLAPAKIEFDEENAKAAVSKGACLLRVMRDTMVGFDVDVSDFKANLLADLFYKSSMGKRRVLFTAGPIHDLEYVEESPDPGSFARHLAVFYGAPSNLLGRFDFSADGEPLPGFADHAHSTGKALGLSGPFPDYAQLMQQRKQEPQAYAEIVSGLRDWPERALIAWIEESASSGSRERPIYRYYLTRNRTLLAVRDRGGDKRLFALRIDDRAQRRVPAWVNPFSGVH